MNIQNAKEQIKNAVIAYRTRDEYGRLVIPVHRQRPVFLLGAPGIGKTAIMEQIASELGIPLVSYSMTHHTRQSALGLPFIHDRDFDGKSYRVSEYTMSEIIAAVYERMEETGSREGILFLDEINCVSETLAPAMLQFLQYKVFGQHQVPEGWIVVTAGNPPEYNRSVREFDMVTWDRVKRIEVEPDWTAWRGWAADQGVHPSILSYLEVRTMDFWNMETTVEGKRFVTPRGWVDLSEMIHLYEKNGLPVEENLISQYLQNPETARQFAIYWDLWKKYRSDYQIPSILAGKNTRAIAARAEAAKFDERIALVGLMMDALRTEIAPVVLRHTMFGTVVKPLRDSRAQTLTMPKPDLSVALQQLADKRLAELDRKLNGQMISREAEKLEREAVNFLRVCAEKAKEGSTVPEAFQRVKVFFDAEVARLKTDAAEAGEKLTNALLFTEDAFGEGQEMLILVTEMTASRDISLFIATYGCEAYYRHNKSLLFYQRQMNVLSELERLDLDGHSELE